MHRNPEANSISRKVAAYGSDYEALLADTSILCFKNEQTRMLSNTNSVAPPIERDLHRAMENLKQFAFVGIFDDIDRLKRFVAERIGVSAESFPQVNGAEIPVENEAAFRQQLAAANLLDRRLYDWVVHDLETDCVLGLEKA